MSKVRADNYTDRTGASNPTLPYGVVVTGVCSATSNNTRGIFAGGNTDGGVTNKIQYITIDTTGNASDFGDLTHGKQNLSSLAGS